ncbi:DUF6242 domain-containing protein [Prevotella sp. AGR2160]|uniref:DUF6242 domain-containing protein n=1 Tax=Prevotella sp. AGR2160 TaxID=1280674 RepID=UPI0003FA29D8|nr:DUF6242 domain-containing protein [Prevotella sp. AGR2160]
MHKKIILLATLLSVVLALSSCLGNDDEDTTTYSDDTAITAFSISTYKYLAHTTSSTGADSTYTTTASGTKYKFVIDQAQGLIYNPDSLPYGTDPSKLLISVTNEASGVTAYLPLDADGNERAEVLDSMRAYSSSDTISFAKPRHLFAFNILRTAYRKYLVKVNVHRQDSAAYQTVKVATVETFKTLKGMKAFAWDDKMVVTGTHGSDLCFFTTDKNDGTTWKEIIPTSPANATFSSDAWKRVVATDDAVYLYDNGQIYASTDLKTWTASNMLLSNLATDGTTTDSLPTTNANLALIPSTTNADMTIAVLTGMADGHFVSWYGYYQANRPFELVYGQPRAYKTNSGGTLSQQMYFPGTVSATAYGSDLEALCRKENADGTISTTLLTSKDKGITWQTDLNASCPITLSSVYGFAGDSSNWLWFIDAESGQIVKYRQNYRGWTIENKDFTE